MLLTKVKDKNLSILFISAFISNLFCIYFIDLLNLDLKLAIIFGSFFTHFVGFTIIIKNFKRFKDNRFFDFYLLFLIFLVIFRINFDSGFIDFFRIALYKFGFLNFYFYGLETFLAIDILRNKLSRSEMARKINLFFKVLVIYTFAIILIFAKNKLNYEINIGNYQSLADVVHIISIFYILLNNLFFRKKTLSLYFSMIGLSILTFIMGSSSTIVFLVANLISDTLIQSSKKAIVKIIVFITSPIILLFIFYSILKNNFDKLYELGLSPGYMKDILDFSSPLLSRIEILKSFSSQIKVSPILGNWNSEIISGAGLGNFLHSIPLSFMTHTGIVGFSVFILLIFSLFKNKIKFIKDIPTKTGLILFLNVIIIGSLSKFLTFIPFWYLLGFLSLNLENNKLENMNKFKKI